MNREQRRKYDKQIKNDKIASICPECNAKARFFTSARGEKDTVLKCERYGQIVREGEELTRLMPPGLYLPMPLESLDRALLAEAARVEEEKENDEPATSGYVAVEGEVN